MAGSDRAPILISGYKALEAELKELKKVERPAVISAIEEARAHGDLSENAEYHAAKDKQGMIEARIADLEDSVGRAEVVDPKALSGDTVMFGATVTLLDENDKKVKYQLVSRHEADVKLGLISYTSPLGQALITRSVGDDAEVHTPAGERFYEIVKIEYK